MPQSLASFGILLVKAERQGIFRSINIGKDGYILRSPLPQVNAALQPEEMRDQRSDEDKDECPMKQPYARPELAPQQVAHTNDHQDRPQCHKPGGTIYISKGKRGTLYLLHASGYGQYQYNQGNEAKR